MSSKTGAASDEANLGRAIAFVVVGMTCFGISDAIAKLLVADLPVFEVIWARYAFHFVFLFVLLRPGACVAWSGPTIREFN